MTTTPEIQKSVHAELLALREAVEDAAGAIDAMQHQIGQMKGMFSDEDGTIAAAEEAADDALESIQAARQCHVPEVVHSVGLNSRFVTTLQIRDAAGGVLVQVDGSSTTDGNNLVLIDTLSGFDQTQEAIISVRQVAPTPVASETPSHPSALDKIGGLSLVLDAEEWDRIQADEDEFVQHMVAVAHALAKVEMTPQGPSQPALELVIEKNLQTGEILWAQPFASVAEADQTVGDMTTPGRIRSRVPLHLPEDLDDFIPLGRFLLIQGNPGGKMTFSGPFDGAESAAREGQSSDVPFSVMELQQPLLDLIEGEDFDEIQPDSDDGAARMR